MKNKRLPPRYRVVYWYRWQESKTLLCSQCLAVFTSLFALVNEPVWHYVVNSTIGFALVIIALAGMLCWVHFIFTKIEIFALKDHILFTRNGKLFIDIPLTESDAIHLTYQPYTFPLIYKGSGRMTITHHETKVGTIPIYSAKIVSYVACNLSQFINCHPDLVKHT